MAMMDSPTKPRTCRNLLVRVLLFGVIAMAVRFAYVVTVIGGAGCDSGDFCLFSSPPDSLPIAGSTATAAHVRIPDGVVSTTASPTLRRRWTSREWRRSVEYYSVIFNKLRSNGYLSPSSKSLCLDTPTGYEVLALKEIGVKNAIGVAKKKSLPLVLASDPFKFPFSDSDFDFVFAGRAIDRSKSPADLATEISRVLKPQGFLVLHTNSAQDAYSLSSLKTLFSYLNLIRSHKINSQDSDSNSSLQEFIFHNSELNPNTIIDLSEENLASSSFSNGNSVNKCPIPSHKLQILNSAEPLIEQEPLKPWLTLKRNIKNIKYLPNLADISFKKKYNYIDVGSRSYGSSIGSWFKKQYPKQNHTFQIYAIEADNSFYNDYKSRKGVTLLPYAAWVRNETLKFEINQDHERKEDEKGGGMGRIRPVTGSAAGVLTGEVREIKGFDFSDWVKKSFDERDYVVMKMDVEGTEFELIPKLVESGAICLIDELFLECHYDRWQKCCPGVRSPKYRNTYGECLGLFRKLRESGVLVHQWF
ncbi:hypothetical protein LUZ60_013101 [Juncus effusus]|nr:hypothetical protein LUZ60_013101 [Juncus effusus]